MSGLISKLLAPKRRHVFTFALDHFPGKEENNPVDDIVAPDLAEGLGVFIFREEGGVEDRVLAVDTDNDITPEQITEVFRRHGVAARLLTREENEQ